MKGNGFYEEGPLSVLHSNVIPFGLDKCNIKKEVFEWTGPFLNLGRLVRKFIEGARKSYSEESLKLLEELIESIE